MLPKHVRYQTALHPDTYPSGAMPEATSRIISNASIFVNSFLGEKTALTENYLIETAGIWPSRHSSRLPWKARSRVTSSVYSSSPPTGTPWAMRVTRTPMGLMSREM